jgi:hypothetical protein
MAYENVNATPNFQRQVLGQKGFRTIGAAGTGQAGEFYRAITATDYSVISVTSESGDNLSSAELPAGVTIYGLFSAVSVTSGRILAYIA